MVAVLKSIVARVTPRSRRTGLPGDLWLRGAPVFGCVLALATLWAPAAAAAQIPLHDLVEIEGAGPNHLKGTGVVFGLKGNGDTAKGEVLAVLKDLLGNEFGRSIGEINSRNVALVSVTATLPPFQKVGTMIDVRVAAIGDAASLAGGTLFLTPLRGPGAMPEDRLIFGLAQGRIVVEGEPRTGNPTAGVVKRGGILEAELRQEFVSLQGWSLFKPRLGADGTWDEARAPFEPAAITASVKTIVLNLKKADIEMATSIAQAINSHLNPPRDPTVAGGQISGPLNLPRPYLERNPFAQVVDGGRVRVRLPSRDEYMSLGLERLYPGYEAEPANFLSELLRKVTTVLRTPSRARVLINDANKTVAVVGEVTVKPGYVTTEGVRLDVKSNMSLTQWLVENGDGRGAQAKPLSPQQIIDLIRAMDAAGMIEGEVVGP
jgi:flagellar basal body P-ring protein FlgI